MSFTKYAERKAVIFLQAQIKPHLRVYRETVRHLESKERLCYYATEHKFCSVVCFVTDAQKAKMPLYMYSMETYGGVQVATSALGA